MYTYNMSLFENPFKNLILYLEVRIRIRIWIRIKIDQLDPDPVPHQFAHDMQKCIWNMSTPQDAYRLSRGSWMPRRVWRVWGPCCWCSRWCPQYSSQMDPHNPTQAITITLLSRTVNFYVLIHGMKRYLYRSRNKNLLQKTINFIWKSRVSRYLTQLLVPVLNSYRMAC